MKVELIAPLNRMDSNMWGHYFRIPDEVALQFTKGKDRRVLCTLNNKETIHCALMPSPQGYFIMINQSLRRKLKLSLGDAVKLEIEKDTSEYGMNICEEFEAVILEDDEVKPYFEGLTKGRQRSLLYLVGKIKNSEVRINRAMAIAHYLKVDKGVIDYKRLNEVIKEFNQKNRL